MNDLIVKRKESDLMRYHTITEHEKTCDEILTVLEKNKVPISSLDKLLLLVKEMALQSSNVQNLKEETASEVPVQKQPSNKDKEWLYKEFNINLTQEQFDKIAILDLCSEKYRAEEILKLLKILDVI